MPSDQFGNKEEKDSQEDISKRFHDIFGEHCPEFKNQIDNQEPIISFEDWQIQLNQKLDDLKQTINENFLNLWDSLEFELAIKNILHIKDITLPFAGILLGSPSSMKTLGIELFRNIDNTFYSDNFSAKSFVSHNTSVKRTELSNRFAS